MDRINHPQLREVLRSGRKITYLCGAGLSKSLGKHANDWGTWLESGKAYLSAGEQAELKTVMGDRHAKELVAAAGWLLPRLKAAGTYRAFMDESFAKLRARDEGLIRAFRLIDRAGDLIATTNYDRLLENAVGIGTVTYSDPATILRILTGDAPRQIIHLHGAYDPAHGVDDIIADDEQYDKIIAHDGAQFLQRLIGTEPLIIVGCGGTVEDRNLSGFLSFAAVHLNADIPYFYLYREGSDLSALPPNIIPVCYGATFDDLPSFLEELASYRIRQRNGMDKLMSVDPYKTHPASVSAFGRMHFLNGFNPFVGREAETARLRDFCEQAAPFSWWTVIGEGGIGKSRLVLEWLRGLPPGWLGFFAALGEHTFEGFQPFTDMVVVFDYLLGREAQCAEAASALLNAFLASPYHLRILLLERHLEEGKETWLTKLRNALLPDDRLAFDAGEYQTPLMLGPLDTDCETRYVQEYLGVYLPRFTDSDTQHRYQRKGVSAEIQQAFHDRLPAECRRPLYLSVFIEVWVYHEGDVAVESAEKLLEEYMTKEERRWRTRFHDDEKVLYAFLKLLAMACAVETFCVNEYDEGYLANECARLTAFLQSEQRAGKKKLPWTDLFIEEAIEDPTLNNGQRIIRDIFENGELDEDEKRGYATYYAKLLPDEQELAEKASPDYVPHVFWLMKPVYPDIIKEFIVDYYTDEASILPFTRLARQVSTLEFVLFLQRALDDFPEKASFRRMLVIGPGDPAGMFEYCIGLLSHVGKVVDAHGEIERNLLRMKTPQSFRIYELGAWARLAGALAESGDIDGLADSSLRFSDYADRYIREKGFADNYPETLRAYAVGLHNEKRVDALLQLAARADALADIVPEDDGVATECMEVHRCIFELKHVFQGDRGLLGEWEKIAAYYLRLPADSDNADILFEVGVTMVDTLTKKRLPGRLRKVNAVLEGAYPLHRSARHAGQLAICLANEHACACHIYIESDGPDAAEAREAARKAMEPCLSALTRLLEEHPEEQKVITGYAVARSTQLYIVNGHDTDVTHDECLVYKRWFAQHPDDIDFAESYSRMLRMRFETLLRQGDTRAARRCVEEVRRIGRDARLEEYLDADAEEFFEMADAMNSLL